MTDAKFKLEDILNKKKAPPQILDLANMKIETEEEFRWKMLSKHSFPGNKLEKK